MILIPNTFTSIVATRDNNGLDSETKFTLAFTSPITIP